MSKINNYYPFCKDEGGKSILINFKTFLPTFRITLFVKGLIPIAIRNFKYFNP